MRKQLQLLSRRFKEVYIQKKNDLFKRGHFSVYIVAWYYICMNEQPFKKMGTQEMRAQVDTMNVIQLEQEIHRLAREITQLQTIATDESLSESERDQAHEKVMSMGAQIQALDIQKIQALGRLGQ